MRDTDRKRRIRKIKQKFSGFLLENVLIDDVTNEELDLIYSELIQLLLNDKMTWEYAKARDILESPLINKE